MAVHTAQLYYFQGLQHQPAKNRPKCLFQPDSLALLSDCTVSFNDGRPHGSWQFNSDLSRLFVTFHFKGQSNKTRCHEFQAIAESTCYVMTSRDGVPCTDAVLIPRMRPPSCTLPAAATPKLSAGPRKGHGPRRSKCSDFQLRQ